MALGLDAWITKPIDLSTLYDTLRRACAGEVDALPTSPASPMTWSSDLEFTEQLKTVFRESMRTDVPQVWNALSRQDIVTLMAILHRMRGSLAVMKVDQMALFSELLETRISVEGLTPTLENAARSMLRELESVMAALQ